MDIEDIRPETREYLANRYKNSKKTQQRNGVIFALSREDYYTLIFDHPHALKRIIIRHDRWIRKGMPGKFSGGYVLTWRSREAKKGGIMDITTACYASAMESKRNCRFVLGDKHTPASKQRISDALRGVPKSDETKAKMSAAHLGTTQSEETKAKRRATWARKRAANGTDKSGTL